MSQNHHLHEPAGTRLLAYLELVRLPNVLTAVADVAMGYLFSNRPLATGFGLHLALLAGASSLLYAAGVVLNDVADYRLDCRERPLRPLPSGRVTVAGARRLGFGLLVAGVLLAWSAALAAASPWPGLIGTLLAALVVLYDFWLKPTLLGPVAMGACRSLNVLMGMSATKASWSAAHAVVVAGVGTYVSGVTWLARTESQPSRRAVWALASAVMVAGVALLAWFPAWFPAEAEPPLVLPPRWHVLMAALGLLIAYRCGLAVIDPTPRRVQAAVKQSIFSLIILSAAVCLAVQGFLPAVMILLLLVPTMILGRWVYST